MYRRCAYERITTLNINRNFIGQQSSDKLDVLIENSLQSDVALLLHSGFEIHDNHAKRAQINVLMLDEVVRGYQGILNDPELRNHPLIPLFLQQAKTRATAAFHIKAMIDAQLRNK